MTSTRKSIKSDRIRKENRINEKISIEFTGKEFDYIMQYMKLVEATTVQNAILNAVSIAMDEADA